jgi:hypothetical protein
VKEYQIELDAYSNRPKFTGFVFNAVYDCGGVIKILLTENGVSAAPEPDGYYGINFYAKRGRPGQCYADAIGRRNELFYASKVLAVTDSELILKLSDGALAQPGDIRAMAFHASAGGRRALGSFIFKTLRSEAACFPPPCGDDFPGKVFSELARIKDKLIQTSAMLEEFNINFNARISALESLDLGESILSVNQKLASLEEELENLIISGGGAVWE